MASYLRVNNIQIWVVIRYIHAYNVNNLVRSVTQIGIQLCVRQIINRVTHNKCQRSRFLKIKIHVCIHEFGTTSMAKKK